MSKNKSLLETIEECADIIRLKLLEENSDESISIHVSKQQGLVHYNKEKNTYARRDPKEEWQKI